MYNNITNFKNLHRLSLNHGESYETIFPLPLLPSPTPIPTTSTPTTTTTTTTTNEYEYSTKRAETGVRAYVCTHVSLEGEIEEGRSAEEEEVFHVLRTKWGFRC